MRNFFCAMMALLLSGCAAEQSAQQTLEAIHPNSFYATHLAGRDCVVRFRVVWGATNTIHEVYLYSFNLDGSFTAYSASYDQRAREGAIDEYNSPEIPRTRREAATRLVPRYTSRFVSGAGFTHTPDAVVWTTGEGSASRARRLRWLIHLESGVLVLRNVDLHDGGGSGRMECAPRL